MLLRPAHRGVPFLPSPSHLRLKQARPCASLVSSPGTWAKESEVADLGKSVALHWIPRIADIDRKRVNSYHFGGTTRRSVSDHARYRALSSTATTSPSTMNESSICRALDEASAMLPQQAILENFVHHNPLEHLQQMPMRDAVQYAHSLESKMSIGERVNALTGVDPRKRVNDALVELSSAYLDRGAAKWAPQFRDKGFLYFFASLECLGRAPWRRHARITARRIQSELSKETDQWAQRTVSLAAELIQENLDALGVEPGDQTDALRALLLELKGWAGMFHRMETHPAEAPESVSSRLIEFSAVQCILTRASIESLALQSGGGHDSLSSWIAKAPKEREKSGGNEWPQHDSALSHIDQSADRREALETEFKYSLIHAIGSSPASASPSPLARPAVQVYTCIDDRCCSFRRHLERSGQGKLETFGVAGFFGVPVRYKPADGGEEMILAPEGQLPPALIVEVERAEKAKLESYHRREYAFARAKTAWENASFSPVGSLFLSCLAPFSFLRLLLLGLSPSTSRAIKDQFHQTVLRKPETDFALPYTPQQGAALLARTFKDIGVQDRFAPIVLILGHGARSVNNPFAAAYNCGACGGREGAVSARLMARLGNNKEVRNCLATEHGVRIPDDSVLVGGMHNTTSDTVEYFDVDAIPFSHLEEWKQTQQYVEEALGKNALERCNRFFFAQNIRSPHEALRHVQKRGLDPAEVRPELNHATNAAVVVGRRELTRDHFLDRRVFLPSYDPFSDDVEGTNLEHVLAPALTVCSGINLEYLFSTIDTHHAAGTKAPLNIVGNVGVLQGTTGDLRPGLPAQMTEMHVPVRSLFIVDAPIERVEAVLGRREDLARLVYNEWVRFVVRNPDTGKYVMYTEGCQYTPIEGIDTFDFVPFSHHLKHAKDVTRRETLLHYSALAGMQLACGLPLYLYAGESMNPHGPAIAMCGTLLALPVLCFSRRYLHGEYMFGRFQGLSVGLVTGFNLVALAPSLMHVLQGWGLFGFASTFLIGAYNERPTVRNNATFAFAAYRISDFALLSAAVYAQNAALTGDTSYDSVVAGSLILAALMKSSQFPLTSLFARSMEGPTPASALGYAGLSAHVGIVLLSSTLPLWFEFEWARMAVGGVGALTAVHETLVSRIRADRKGSIANATSAAIGLIYVIMALGYSDLALALSFGHAAFRMNQILRSPNVISDQQKLRKAMGKSPWPRVVPDWLYKSSWALRRVDSDFHVLHTLHRLSRRLRMPSSWRPSRQVQWLLTASTIGLAGAPFTPLSHYIEEQLGELLLTQPSLAIALMVTHFGMSVVLIRFLFMNVLNVRRFQRIRKDSFAMTKASDEKTSR